MLAFPNGIAPLTSYTIGRRHIVEQNDRLATVSQGLLTPRCGCGNPSIAIAEAANHSDRQGNSSLWRSLHASMPVSSGGGLSSVFFAMRPALFRFLSSRGASAEEAEDILQDVQLKLLADNSGPVAQARAYLYKVTNNHFLIQRRSMGRRVRREEDWVDVHGSGSEIDDQPSIETELIARQQVEILQSVLDRMPERTRLIFSRFRIDGEQQSVIAADLGISVSAVEKHLARAYGEISAARLRLDEEVSNRRHLKGGKDRYAI